MEVTINYQNTKSSENQWGHNYYQIKIKIFNLKLSNLMEKKCVFSFGIKVIQKIQQVHLHHCLSDMQQVV
jgi:hypothetical protein